MKASVLSMLLFFCSAISLSAQVDKREVRSGNRNFRKENFREAELDYRRAVVKDSLSFAGEYDLASALYRRGEYDAAQKALDVISEVAPSAAGAADYFFNKGDIALQKKDYKAAMDAFRESLLLNPSDVEAKENYIYAKLMLQNEGEGGGGGNDDQQQDDNRNDQDNQDNQDNQDSQDNQDNQDNQENQDKRNQQQNDQKISPQQAQQLLQAIQAKEKDTQDKVNKEKAEAMKSRQKEKNW